MLSKSSSMLTMEANKNDNVEVKIEFTNNGMLAHSFSEKLGNSQVMFSVLKLKDSLFLWIGSEVEPRMVNMCVAMKSTYDTLPLTTQILGSRTDDLSTGLASKLTRRLGKPVFVSVNLELDRFLIPELSKRVNKEIQDRPEFF